MEGFYVKYNPDGYPNFKGYTEAEMLEEEPLVVKKALYLEGEGKDIHSGEAWKLLEKYEYIDIYKIYDDGKFREISKHFGEFTDRKRTGETT